MCERCGWRQDSAVSNRPVLAGVVGPAVVVACAEVRPVVIAEHSAHPAQFDHLHLPVQLFEAHHLEHFPGGAVAATRQGARAVTPSVKMPPDDIKGPNGAGDAFAAGALYAVHQGWELDRVLELNTCSRNRFDWGTPPLLAAVHSENQ